MEGEPLVNLVSSVIVLLIVIDKRIILEFRGRYPGLHLQAVDPDARSRGHCRGNPDRIARIAGEIRMRPGRPQDTGNLIAPPVLRQGKGLAAALDERQRYSDAIAFLRALGVKRENQLRRLAGAGYGRIKCAAHAR